MTPAAERARRWVRPAVLLLILWGISVVPGTPLVALALLVQLALLPRPRTGPALFVAIAAALLVFSGPGDGLWFVVRGWGLVLGLSFVAVTLYRPAAPFISRALGALVAAVAIVALLFQWGPPDWQVVDWLVGSRIRQVGATALEGVRLLAGERTATPTLLGALSRMIEWQVSVYPGILLVSSLCALAVAWWVYVRVAQGSDRALGPLRDFRFSDQWVWIVVAGFALVLLGASEGWSRAGASTLVFMAALYVARGAAVVVFLTGGVSWAGVALALVGLALLPQVLVGGTFMVGLSDTWLDIRGRARAVLNG
ncbi:MAG: DUF2232 domain-containing protein [Gemmatimonadota bacterium]|nr:DUF2232 domain-containing protein [Gemmatimonadota bacterium]